MSKQDRSAARDLKGEHWGLSGSGLFRGAGMSSEELAWAGQEGGPLTLQPRLRFLRHLSRGAHRSVCPVLTVALCSKQPPPSQPQVGGVAWAQMPFMNGQSWRKAAPFRTGTAPHTSELTLEPPPSWQCRHCREPGHIGWRGMALPEGPPPHHRNHGPTSQERAARFGRVLQMTLPSRAHAGGWSPYLVCFISWS